MNILRHANLAFSGAILLALTGTAAYADNTDTKFVKDCYESRIEGSPTKRRVIGEDEWPNVKCSPDTGGVLWWGDPYDGTVPMGDMPTPSGPSMQADYAVGEAVVKPRTTTWIDRGKLYTICTEACHNDSYQKPPETKKPRLLKMHTDIVPNSLELQHGRGAIWCLDCHNANNRQTLVDNFGEEISFNQPQKLCGKCHGPILRDWRDGIHGKRIGDWRKEGKKRWWVCTECHNPHDVQQGNRNKGFAQLYPEPKPETPKGMPNTDHENVVHGPGH